MKTIIYNDDGWSSYMRYPAPMSVDDILRITLLPVTNTSVSVYQFCSLGGHAVNYNSAFLPRVGETLDSVDTMHVWRMRETLRYLDSIGTDPLEIITNACHQSNIACQFSLRMNDAHHTYTRPDGSLYFPELYSPWLDAHSEALLENGQLDYSHQDVFDYRIQQITEILSKYEVDGIDLDFTRFKPFFKSDEIESGMPKLSELVHQLRNLTNQYGKTLSARFEYEPESCIASGLEVEKWLASGYFDQITLGGVGDHTPDASSKCWAEHAHPAGCKVYPGIEGQLHWLSNSGGGGTGTHNGNGVEDGYGPPSMEYMRAVASVHYMNDADGISLFNFSCADGLFPLEAFTELADPKLMELRNKQYVGAMWASDAQIYCATSWVSRFKLGNGEDSAEYNMEISDDIYKTCNKKIRPACLLIMDFMGLNRIDDIAVSINETPVLWNGNRYNHYDCGCWNDTLQFNVPCDALHKGSNIIRIVRNRVYEGFAGTIEVRKLVLSINYPQSFAPGIGVV